VVAQFETAAELLPEYEARREARGGVVRFLVVVSEGLPAKPEPAPVVIAATSWWTRSRRMKRETAREDVPRVRVRVRVLDYKDDRTLGRVSDRARQDSPESIVGDVRATPAPARHSDQAGAPARPAALIKGLRRLSRWRLAVGVLLFAALAPLSLVALPLAALLVAARPATRGEWVAVALAGAPEVALLAGPEKRRIRRPDAPPGSCW